MKIIISSNVFSNQIEWLEFIDDYHTVPAESKYVDIANQIVQENTPIDCEQIISVDIRINNLNNDEIVSFSFGYLDDFGFCFT